MELEKILKLVEAVSASELTGFTLEENGMRLALEKRPGAADAAFAGDSVLRTVPVMQTPAAVSAEAFPALQPAFPAAASGTTTLSEGTSVVASESVSLPKAASIGEDVSGEEIVKAPLVGTFYAAPSEDAEPFVRAGDSVKAGQVLGIIEAMKLMNEIECECDGVVEAVLISNEQVVEYGQPLFRIRRKG